MANHDELPPLSERDLAEAQAGGRALYAEQAAQADRDMARDGVPREEWDSKRQSYIEKRLKAFDNLCIAYIESLQPD